MTVLLGRMTSFVETANLYTGIPLIYTTIFVLLPTYLCVFIKQKSTEQYSLHYHNSIMLPVLRNW